MALTSYARSSLSDTSTHVLVAGGQDIVFAAVDALTHTLMALRPTAARRHLDFSADITADHAY
nr:hypothetical protein [Streptomyces sp. SID161]